MLLTGIILWSGCSSSSDTAAEPQDESVESFETAEEIVQQQDTTVQAQPPAVKPAPVKKQPPVKSTTQRFSVQADTVDVQHKKRGGTQTSSVLVKASTPKKFYTVEVGAFRLQSNVKRHQQQLGARFKLPVRVLYDSSINLTRVCVGTFSSRSFAVTFMKKMQAQYPADYPDSWVSYWTK